jgi:glyoxylase-like metal-dependent hydrolase (beta-lactamase superfamily II)
MSLAGAEWAAPSWLVGEVRVTRIEEAAHRLPIDQFIPSADAEQLRRHRQQLSLAQVDADAAMTLVMSAFVVESRGRRLLVDTCVGPEHEYGDPGSPFLDRLAAAGFPPASIDAVVCTHVHFDHIGWNTVLVDGARQPAFERADYFFCADEWAALRDAERTGLLGSVGTNVEWLLDRGRASLVPPSYRLTDEVSLLPTFGHSPGHVAILLESSGQHAVITGDAAHHPIQLLAPELATVADFDPAGAVSSRQALIDRVIDTDAVVFGTHFADPCAVRLEGRSEAGAAVELSAVKPVSAVLG